MSRRTELYKVRCGGRNYLRVGDHCHVKKGGADRTGFRAVVRGIFETPAGIEVEVAVARLSDSGNKQRKAGTIRTVRLDRIERRRGPKQEESA